MELTPMQQQYMEIKAAHPNEILFFRLGDFYEMFFDDAKLVSRELELTLTGKSCGLEERAPMCGVPFHSADTYLAKLVEKGYKVAICEQVEDPATTKGLVKREVIKVVTPGTILSDNALVSAQNNYIALVYEEAGDIYLAGADISTGECFYCIYRGENQLIPHGDTRLKAGDTLVVQLRGKNHIANQARINLAARQSVHD